MSSHVSSSGDILIKHPRCSPEQISQYLLSINEELLQELAEEDLVFIISNSQAKVIIKSLLLCFFWQKLNPETIRAILSKKDIQQFYLKIIMIASQRGLEENDFIYENEAVANLGHATQALLSNPHYYEALDYLVEAEILPSDIKKISCIPHAEIRGFNRVLIILAKNGLLTQENYSDMIELMLNKQFISVKIILSENGRINQEQLDLMVRFSLHTPDTFWSELSTPPNLPGTSLSLFKILHDAELIGRSSHDFENLEKILKLPHPLAFLDIIEFMNRSGVPLTQDIFDIITQPRQTNILCELLHHLKRSNLLNHESINLLLKYPLIQQLYYISKSFLAFNLATLDLVELLSIHHTDLLFDRANQLMRQVLLQDLQYFHINKFNFSNTYLMSFEHLKMMAITPFEEFNLISNNFTSLSLLSNTFFRRASSPESYIEPNVLYVP